MPDRMFLRTLPLSNSTNSALLKGLVAVLV
jgi:hypothetical protein